MHDPAYQQSTKSVETGEEINIIITYVFEHFDLNPFAIALESTKYELTI